jgi:hypothetical protein
MCIGTCVSEFLPQPLLSTASSLTSREDNLRYAISTCLFGNPREVENPVNSPCIIDYACLPLEDSLAVDFNSTDDKGTWAYCDEKKDQFTVAKLQSCVSCLKASTDQSYLANCKHIFTFLHHMHGKADTQSF